MPRNSRIAMVVISAFVALSSVRAESPTADVEQTLLSAGLSGDGPTLLAFFHARARTEVNRDCLRELLRQFRDGSKQERDEATMELLGLGPLALPLMRQTASDLDHPDPAARASRCLPWLEGPSNSRLLMAAARSLAQRKPAGAAGALLAYLPFAVDADVIAAVNAALRVVAAPDGKPDADLLRGLADVLAVRRAAAGVALCYALPPDQVPPVRKLLKDPAAGVRLRAALALAEAHDAEAIPVLIDLLAELNAEERAPVEEFLTQLAGEWAPRLQFVTDDAISRRIRRDAWASWWRHTDGATLLATVRKHTLNAETRKNIDRLITHLGDDSFTVRANASKELFALGRLALPQLQEASKSKDAEVAQRAKQTIERIEREPAHPLPAVAVRLLALRKPAGAVNALLAYLPHAEDEGLAEDVQKSLAALARHEGQAEPVLRQALEGPRQPPAVRMRVALALAVAGECQAVPVLIDLLAVLPDEQANQVEAALSHLAGETAPQTRVGTEAAERKKCRDAWAAWWKANAKRADLTRLGVPSLRGCTLICDNGKGRVYEIDRHGKERWAINNLKNPLDAVVLADNRVLIADCQDNRVTERDFQGNILWQKQVDQPTCVQRLPNGNTFIATYKGTILEVDRGGREIYKVQNIPESGMSAFRSRKGPIVYLTRKGECVLADTTGKRLKSFDTHHAFTDTKLDWIDRSANGGILIVQDERNKVVEYTAEGKKVLEVDAPQATTATALPNGHLLVASPEGQRVYELDRAGKVVWEHKNAGHAFRARRR